eukprot:scaffold145417_cov19-Tisochrysis_lutea.AAC.2
MALLGCGLLRSDKDESDIYRPGVAREMPVQGAQQTQCMTGNVFKLHTQACAKEHGFLKAKACLHSRFVHAALRLRLPHQSSHTSNPSRPHLSPHNSDPSLPHSTSPVSSHCLTSLSTYLCTSLPHQSHHTASHVSPTVFSPHCLTYLLTSLPHLPSHPSPHKFVPPPLSTASPVFTAASAPHRLTCLLTLSIHRLRDPSSSVVRLKRSGSAAARLTADSSSFSCSSGCTWIGIRITWLKHAYQSSDCGLASGDMQALFFRGLLKGFQVATDVLLLTPPVHTLP